MWWSSKPIEDDKYILIEDKLETFQNTISKLQTEMETFKKSQKEDLEKLKKDFENMKNTKSQQTYTSPYDLLTRTETMSLDEFLNEPIDIIAEDGSIKIGGSYNPDLGFNRKSERIKNLNNKKCNTTKKKWKA